MKAPVKAAMKTALILSALLVGFASSAYASSHGETTYRDLIRPHGQPRSDAIYDAAVNGCYAQTHESRTALYDTPAYKACMLQKGYRFLSTKVVQDPVPATTYATNRSDDDDDWYAQHEANDDAERQAQWQQQMQQGNDAEQASMDAANAGYAADAAQAAANVAAAASFDAQMTVGN
jgi:hypothetical protein